MNYIELAKQVGAVHFKMYWLWDGMMVFTETELEKFAALVEAAARADEREACAKVCDELHRDWKWRAAESIRARGTT